ncbi:hypothetical protein DL95DRAFT_504868 [Leptodontidium sp. 2 PMI_412]|nr:hypothetical protein DL95DRAFT_504868 [Leptodontidium sp. 2 PMI_412]
MSKTATSFVGLAGLIINPCWPPEALQERYDLSLRIIGLWILNELELHLELGQSDSIPFSTSGFKSSKDRMAEVSFAPMHPDGNTSFPSSALHRSHSMSSFPVRSSSLRPAQEPYARTECNNRIPTSAHSTASSYPRRPQADCWGPSLHTSSTFYSPADTKCGDGEGSQVVLPSYNDAGYYKKTLDLEPPTSPWTNDTCTVSLASDSTPTNNSRPDSPVPAGRAERAEDDTMVWVRPSRYVDYLSHDWREEDIWSSWKHIASKGKLYGNSTRLENASWRTWTKSKYRLKAVSPETLNWLKDCDATWLYGPLQTSSDNLSSPSTSAAGIGISQLNCFLNKKPILKKRSRSEVMVQMSKSASSLLNHATSAVRAQRSDATFTAQKSDRVSIGKVTSGYVTLPLSLKSWRQDNVNELPSITLSGEQSLETNERRHVHFNDKVEQFVAVDVEDGDDDEDAGDIDGDDDSSSDDGLMMKRSSKPNVLNQNNQNNTQTNFSAEGSSIAILPSTTLKYRVGAPELTEPTTKILLDSQDENADVSRNLSSTFAKYQESISVTHGKTQLNTLWVMNGGGECGDLHSPPGTFMCEEGDDDVVATGLIDQVVDAINTAKDIAYVIWNVGWR